MKDFACKVYGFLHGIIHQDKNNIKPEKKSTRFISGSKERLENMEGECSLLKRHTVNIHNYKAKSFKNKKRLLNKCG